VDDAGADLLGLRLHLLHQPGALDDVGEAGVVLHVGGDGQLAAGLVALQHQGLEVGPGGVQSRRQPGGAGTQQVMLAVALSQTASAAAVVSFSLAMQASVTAVNALLGVAAAMAMCRTLRPIRAVQTALAGARA